jgi:hyperosmotically inducible periplasmic protein
MNARIVVLTSALATACGGADARLAQEPAAPTPTLAASDQNRPVVSESLNNSDAHPMSGGPRTSGATETAGTSRGGERTATTGVTDRTPEANAPVANTLRAADQTKDADNTKINDRDRHGALTPMDQGNSGAETKITAAIRRGIMNDKTMSFIAKNVKVITVGNRVTLRGPMKSDEERAAIEAIARQTEGVAEVDDQLEVKKWLFRRICGRETSGGGTALVT